MLSSAVLTLAGGRSKRVTPSMRIMLSVEGRWDVPASTQQSYFLFYNGDFLSLSSQLDLSCIYLLHCAARVCSFIPSRWPWTGLSLEM